MIREFLLIPLLLLFLHTNSQELTDTGYLSVFGYLNTGNSDDVESLVLVTDEDKAAAVREFQRYYGLEETGVVDGATKTAMSTPRCGVPDKNGPGEVMEEIQVTKKRKERRRKRKRNRRKKRYIHSSSQWRHTRLSYRFLNYTSDIPQSMTRAAFREAFDMWEEHSGLEFFEETRSHLRADIEIAYMTGRHKDRSVFNSLVLGHAFFPTVGWLHMNDQQTWNYNSFRGIDTVFVAVHELGHVLGLRHSTVGTIMHASYPGYSATIKLSQDDIDGIQDLYGPNPCNPNPCKNRGVCSKVHLGEESYSCSCSVGWQGNKCQFPIKTADNKKCREVVIANGVASPSGRTSPGERVRIYCNDGFNLIGSSVVRCSHTGHHSPPPSNTVCRPKILCPQLRIDNGQVYPKRGVEAETTVSFGCNDGYQISGATRVKCKTDGSYDRTAPTCVKIEDKEPDFCPDTFDDISSRSVRDSMMYAFRGSRFWIFRRGPDGTPVPHWKHSGEMSNEFPNIPTNLDAVFPYTGSDRKRYMCFVKWPQIYYWDIIAREIRRIDDFLESFPLPVSDQITAALRWDEETIFFFVPRGYFIYHIDENRFYPSFVLPMSNISGFPSSVTVTAATRSFDGETAYLFTERGVYEIRRSDLRVMRNSPRPVSDVWNRGIDECGDA